MKNIIIVTISFLFPLVLFAQWEPDVRLTNNAFESWTSYNNTWCVASSGSNVHVVWYDYRDGNCEIYYKHSTDNGTTWSSDIRLTNNTADSKYPSIAVSGSNVHVVWLDGRDGGSQTYYKHSVDNGTTWSADLKLTSDPSWSGNPSIAVSGSNVHVVWYDGRYGPDQIFYKRSLDNGTNWSSDIRLNNSSNHSLNPSIAVSGSNVHVVWEDYRDGNLEIYYKHSLDNGTNWSADIRLSDYPFDSWRPSVTVFGSNVHVVWEDYRDASYQVYYKRSLDNGTNWSADTKLTNNTTFSDYPSIAISGSNVHVVWEDYRGYVYEIYYKRSLDNGTNWSADTRLTNDFYISWYPSVAVFGLYVHVVWTDNRDGNYEIYYKRNPTGNGIEQEKSLTQLYHALFVSSFFNDQITIRFNQSFKEPIKLTLFDIRGATVFSKTYLIDNWELKIGNFSYLAPGVYFLSIDLNKQNKTHKLIKLR